ncbi:UDP-N-acetylmuramate dehydrogenase [Salinisphaera sp. Q1T1-3]|uniref:UDP-N-acetylmuramate dehydrogenase n=1 Tax=Salinisphaera sp. Q1T1-3 TaxID=2321229 RepID=UPI000E70DE70|nr:UDP-N-acetylmuramate dehydrogenase [Salinisphaera sp. Q1T1-3]RJS94052.1 UDP-N-acetylmuramate dehydrogenase [Salinisphaera sp. Q1T1-3]
MRNPRRPTPAQRRALARRLGPGLTRNVCLAERTSFGIGGPAELYFEARTPEALATAVRVARALDIDWFLLGTGANILVGDRGFAGLVIANRADAIATRGTRLTAASGALIYPDVIDAAVARGLSGLEHYVGIPSSVGGALWQNLHFLSPAPARERTMFIGEVLESADILDADNVRRTVDVDYFEFGYDQSVLHNRDDVVLSATFELEPANGDALTRIMEENLRWRADRHPPLDTEPSAGSIFKKIDGIGAGRLIDEAGLKGFRVGDAEISPRHANIIVNRGRATAAEVCALIMHVQRTVSATTGYWLEPEISFVGGFAPVKRVPATSQAV